MYCPATVSKFAAGFLLWLTRDWWDKGWYESHQRRIGLMLPLRPRYHFWVLTKTEYLILCCGDAETTTLISPAASDTGRLRLRYFETIMCWCLGIKLVHNVGPWVASEGAIDLVVRDMMIYLLWLITLLCRSWWAELTIRFWGIIGMAWLSNL